MPHTEEIEYGLLPTPTAMMDEAPIDKVDARNKKQIEKGNSPFILGLGQQAMRGLLPTPNAMDYNTATKPETYEARKKRHAEKGVNLQMSLRQMGKMNMLPTPIAGDWKGQRRADGTASMLSGKASLGLLPTPTAMDCTNATATMKSTQVKEGSMHSVTLVRAMSMGILPTPTAGSEHSKHSMGEWGGSKNNVRHIPGIYSPLNPQFVAEMMGFTPNWTELPFINGEKNQ